jgi:hypothetical protein
VPVEHVLLQECEEGLHGGVVAAGADRPIEPISPLFFNAAGRRSNGTDRSECTTVPAGERRAIACRSAATAREAFILESME